MSARKHLVVVLPGIGGSVLERPARRGRDARRVWDAGLPDIAGVAWSSGWLSLDEEPVLRAVNVVRSHRLLPGWTVVHGYEGLVGQLGCLPGSKVDVCHPDRGRDPEANVVVFPYDFRRSVRETAELLADEVAARLGDASDEDKRDRVVVVAHSMGGLVARYWLGPLGGWPVCRALITLGTPHRGAPKALGLLYNGVRLLGWEPPASRLIQTWPSIAELLPRYRVVWDGVAEAACYPHELSGESFVRVAKQGFQIHEDIRSAWRQIPREGTEVVPRLGWSHRTLQSAWWDGQRLRMSKDRPSWVSAPGWEQDHGDGTVPAVSALPVEMSGYGSGAVRVRERHSRLASLIEIAALVQSYEARGSLREVEGDDHPPMLGVDLDEMYLAGETIAVRAGLHGEGRDSRELAEVAVWASLREADSGVPLADVRLDWDEREQCAHGELPAQAVGFYDLDVVAAEVSAAGRLAVADTIAVVSE